jgi:enamine deaminase RidA (YjgF/YER057c/UK114 family)
MYDDQRKASLIRLLFVLQDDWKAPIVTLLLRSWSPRLSAEARLKELGLVLPPVPKPIANFLPYRRAGSLLFLSGQGPRDENGASLTGKLGADISLEEGYRRARLVGLGLLAAMRDALGSLDRVDCVVKLLGMVNATPDFNDSPKVINGCSDLFVEVFGEAGRHARSAVGNVMLPNQISVEIEGIVAIKA